MKSLTIYNCTNFNITDSVSILEETKTDNTNENAGSISPNGSSLIISSKTFLLFSCVYNVKVKHDILAWINGAYQPAPIYKEANSFPAFFCNDNNLLIIVAPTPIAKGFTEALKATYPDKVNISGPLNFDFNKIKTFEKHAKGLYFAVDEDTITSKHFFGTGVETDDEAADAIDNEKATYLIANIDVLGKSRTIGFSKKGALVLYSKPSDIDKERPYLELAIETLLTTQSLK